MVSLAKKIVMVCLVLSLVLASTPGCIDVELAKSLFIPKKKVVITYEAKVYTIKHIFVTRIADPSTLQYHNVTEIEVIPDTRYLDVVISASFPELPDFGNDTIRELIETYVPDRYLNVTIYNPNGTPVVAEFINQTTAHPLQLPRVGHPEIGKWKVRVSAQGVGVESMKIYDSFGVRITLSEPVETVVR